MMPYDGEPVCPSQTCTHDTMDTRAAKKQKVCVWKEAPHNISIVTLLL